MKTVFALWGMPQQVISNNGAQFVLLEFKDFAKAYGFQHTADPHFPQANGKAERGIQIAREILS